MQGIFIWLVDPSFVCCIPILSCFTHYFAAISLKQLGSIYASHQSHVFSKGESLKCMLICYSMICICAPGLGTCKLRFSNTWLWVPIGASMFVCNLLVFDFFLAETAAYKRLQHYCYVTSFFRVMMTKIIAIFYYIER